MSSPSSPLDAALAALDPPSRGVVDAAFAAPAHGARPATIVRRLVDAGQASAARALVRALLVETGGSVAAAYRALGMSRATMQRELHALKLRSWLDETYPERPGARSDLRGRPSARRR